MFSYVEKDCAENRKEVAEKGLSRTWQQVVKLALNKQKERQPK
jgi:hypothetical protein